MLWNHLITTSSVIEDIGLANVPTLLSLSSNRMKVTLSKPNSLIQASLQFLLNAPLKGEPLGYWLIVKQSEINEIIQPLSSFRVVFVMKESEQLNDCYNLENVIYIQEFEEAIRIIGMDEKSLISRLKLEKMLVKSQKTYTKKQKQSQIKQLANKLTEKQLKISAKMLTNWMQFYGQKRRKILKKCFEIWCIDKLEKVIANQQQQLVREEYFQEESKRLIKKKYFRAWLGLISK